MDGNSVDYIIIVVLRCMDYYVYVPDRSMALPLMPDESGILLIRRSNATSSCIDFRMLDIMSALSFWNGGNSCCFSLIDALVEVVVVVAVGSFDCSRSR